MSVSANGGIVAGFPDATNLVANDTDLQTDAFAMTLACAVTFWMMGIQGACTVRPGLSPRRAGASADPWGGASGYGG